MVHKSSIVCSILFILIQSRFQDEKQVKTIAEVEDIVSQAIRGAFGTIGEGKHLLNVLSITQNIFILSCPIKSAKEVMAALTFHSNVAHYPVAIDIVQCAPNLISIASNSTLALSPLR